jgi:hypothetical protein
MVFGVLPLVYVLALFAQYNIQKFCDKICAVYVVKQVVLGFEILKAMSIKHCEFLVAEAV